MELVTNVSMLYLKKCTVTVKREGYKWQMKFAKGVPTTKLKQLEETDETGTTISFVPDKEILGDFEIRRRFRTTSK